MVGQTFAEETIYENSGGSQVVAGLRWLDMQNYRDPPPYPGHSKQQQQVFSNQPGFRQSYSGSETSTDVSLSSTENLATSQRQDPQGEETRPAGGYQSLDHLGSSAGGILDGVGGIGGGGGGYSILERLGMPPSALDGAGKFSLSQSPSAVAGGKSSYSAYVQERVRRQEEVSGGSPGNSGSSYPTHGMPGSGGDGYSVSSSSYLSAVCSGVHQPASSSPLYSRGHLTVPQHWQGSRIPPSSPHYLTTSARHESSISSNSSSSSTLTMISRGGTGGGGNAGGGSSGGGGGVNSNFSSSTLSYSSTTNRSSSNTTNIMHGDSNYSSRAVSSSSTPSSHTAPPQMNQSTNPPSSSSPSSSTSSSSYQPPGPHHYMSPRVPPVSTYHHPHPYVNQHWTVGSGDSTSSGSLSSLVTASSSTSSSRLDLLNPSNSNNTSNLNSSGFPNTSTTSNNNNINNSNNVKSSSASSSLNHLPSYTGQAALPPPPDYPGPHPGQNRSEAPRPYLSPGVDNLRPSKSYETMVGGQGPQADLRPGQGHSSQHDLRPCASSPGIYVHDSKMSASRGAESHHHNSNNSSSSSSTDPRLAPATAMVELLTDQNRSLREELATASVKVAKLHKLEQEIQKVHDSHAALVQSSQKREGLWMAMKRKYEERIQALEGKAGQGAASSSVTDTELRIKLAEKDAMISKLLSQNQELSSSRDQLEASNAQLSLSLAEQRAHADILDNALLNAQSRVLGLEDENRKKSAGAEKVEQLQSALSSLQLVSEKQEKREREMRARLEKELEGYRLLEKGNAPKRGEPGVADSKSAGMLRKIMDEKDARILQLETEIAGMEQRYVKEATLRQLNMESNTSEAPKEVRLAALEKSSSDMERLIDEAKTEKLRHMEELHQSHRKVAELEARVKQLQTQLVEKEARLKVFQRSPLAMARSSSLHALCHHASTAHSPRPSLISSSSSTTGSSRASTGGYSRGAEWSTVRHMKTGSASAIELGRKMSMEEDLLTKVQNLRSESKSDSEEEVKLWHV